MTALRPAVAQDHSAILAVVEAAYAPWIAVIGRRPGPMDDDYAARIAAGQVIVAEEAGAVVGLLVTEEHPTHLLIDNVAVSPAAQGRGLGAALLAEAEREAARQGLALLRLYTHAKMAANIARYRRAGFAEVARITEKGFDRVYMQKQLAAGHGA